MHNRLGFPLLTLTILTNLAFAYPPTCSPIYGHPDSTDCQVIVNGFTTGGRALQHFFAVAGTPCPPGVSNTQYANKENIPKFWPVRSSPGEWGPVINNCRAALLPVQNSIDGTLSWDVSRWSPIQQTGLAINHYCVEALGMRGIVGTGGIDPVGDSNQLRLVLYAAKSQFDNDTLDDYKNGRAIAIKEDDGEPAGSDSTEENDPNVPGPSLRPQTRQSGGMGLMSSKGGFKAPRIRSLGSGWYMTYGSVTSVLPAQSAAADLELFYNDIIDSAGSQLYNGANTTTDLAFNFGQYSLRLSSPDPIDWTWIINFAFGMLDTTSGDFVAFFNGEAYSYIYEIAAVMAVLTAV